MQRAPKSIFHFLIGRCFQQLRVFQQLLEQADGLGVIIAVCQTLINGEAQIEHFAHFDRAVLVIDRALRLFADDAEHRAGAPVRQMMIAAVELNGAKIGDHTRRIIRVCLNDTGGYPAVDIQTRQDPDQELAEPTRHVVEKVHAVCVLKDSRTLVKAPEGRLMINTTGNAAMAKAGSGDVLAGMITGLMAQHMRPDDAAVLGVYLHGLCGDHARKELGSYSVLAGDLLKMLGRTLKELEDMTE